MQLKEHYTKRVVPQLVQEFNYSTPMAVPRIEKVVVNIGLGKLLGQLKGDASKKAIEQVVRDLGLITGMRPVITSARQSIAGFKVREGQPVGAKVTLRESKMYDFLERTIRIALPRTRDFQGISLKSIDRSGNLTFAILEHTVYPEISPELSKYLLSFEITVVTTANTPEEALSLLRQVGFPMEKEEQEEETPESADN